ncbi:hypothetical protein HNQ75_003658 [Rhizobium flavum]|uniref:Uncharacterized protein n=1 Tax=Pseudorhizobium flavum TaxID=1335061 RepID=A0A7X0DED1_9HYPH|nr:hypothetical protein [Pseudorhizobium flavum]MBB6181670.1 hypothetical protein [Pseudorhizobium flavum]
MILPGDPAIPRELPPHAALEGVDLIEGRFREADEVDPPVEQMETSRIYVIGNKGASVDTASPCRMSRTSIPWKQKVVDDQLIISAKETFERDFALCRLETAGRHELAFG